MAKFEVKTVAVTDAESVKLGHVYALSSSIALLKAYKEWDVNLYVKKFTYSEAS